MSGILFLKTKDLSSLKDFYINNLNCEIWQDQGDCVIFRHGNFLFGFCERDEIENKAMLTFFYENRDDVDRMYAKLKDVSVSGPTENDKYNIYQCFVKDPDGRMVELQYFNEPVSQYMAGDDLILTRRSIRKFTDEEIPPALLEKILDICRYAPTSRNTQGYYFKVIEDRDTLDWLSETRQASTTPLARAPIAIAICADPTVTARADHDACIAAYHLILTAWFYGLGTCWIGGMDREDIKDRLGIPPTHYLATVVPLGYPAERNMKAPKRKPLKEFLP
ncbi:MAG: nitroreductase family protein [Candidatus Zixiibacteriota bacterium]|nr:MAG: nitroreductase family protein [candidate division Zixibacteria bacterium]